MRIIRSFIVLGLGATLSVAAYAADTGSVVQRDVNQQQRIEQGLQSGALNTREASKREREESRVDRVESNALKDGKLTNAEERRIDNAQDKVSRDIYREKHDAQTGNPNSVSSQRMQADVQRNINQQQRIEQGVQSGQLTNREAGKLEHGQAKVARAEGRAGADGHVGAHEQRHIQHGENKQSRRVYKEKHDRQTRH